MTNNEIMAKANEKLACWDKLASEAWEHYAETGSKAANSRYKQLNERAEGFITALDMLGYTVEYADNGTPYVVEKTA